MITYGIHVSQLKDHDTFISDKSQYYIVMCFATEDAVQFVNWFI
jgi:hypothetical protein